MTEDIDPADRIGEVYCSELGYFCNGYMGCIDCPYRRIGEYDNRREIYED